MPLSTLIVLAVVFTLFGGFILIVGGTHIYLALSDRRASKAVAAPYPAHARTA